MRHRPHLFLPQPWAGESIDLEEAHLHHLTRVLRYPEGGEVTYSDGAGSMGRGTVESGRVTRGDESVIAEPEPRLTIAVAVPRSKDRQRFAVEKLQELGVAELLWTDTGRSQGRHPPAERSRAWAIAAFEQSRGAWLMSIGRTRIGDLDGAVAAQPGGETAIANLRERASVTVLVGPEGGLTDDEAARFDERIDLGPTVLRTETAALAVAAAIRCR